MKVCIVGAGAVGGHLAARLYAAGATISVVARGANLDTIQARGITLRDPQQEIHAPVRATDRPTELGTQDAVIFAVKAPDLLAAVNSARPILSADTRAIFAINGIPWWYQGEVGSGQLSPDAAQVAEIVAPEQTTGSVLYSLCSVPEPGVVEVRNPVSRFFLGDITSREASPVTSELAAVLRSSAMNVEISAEIRDLVWEKLILLLAITPLSVLTQAAPVEIFKHPLCAAISRALIAEAMAVANAVGRNVKIDPDNIIASSRSSEHRPSILQDLDAGRKMEVDVLFTAPLEIARAAEVPTPTLEILTELIKVRARVAGLY